MSKLIKLPITSDCRITVNVGDKVDAGSVIGQKEVSGKEEEIKITSLLKVKPALAGKYLQISIGDRIEKNDIIAKKKNLFSSSIIRSPFSGTVKEINRETGVLNISTTEKGKENLNSPVKGIIRKKDEKLLEIEVDGLVFSGKDGGGTQAVGKLEYFRGDRIGSLEIDRDIAGIVVLCKDLNRDALAKLEALDCSGLIISKKKRPEGLSWVQVDEDVLTKISEHEQKTVCIIPDSKSIIILE